jgi:hypothetical protein
MHGYFKEFLLRMHQIFKCLTTRVDKHRLVTVLLIDAANGGIVGKIIATPGTKITLRELQLSHNTPHDHEALGYYYSAARVKKLKTPFRIFENDSIYILFAPKLEEFETLASD